MLDKNMSITLKVLKDLCDEGVYKVVDYNSLILKFPRKYKPNKLAFEQSLEYLKNRQYIDIKYSENDTYCLCVLPKTRIVLEDSVKESKSIKQIKKLFVLNLILSGIMAFLGAFLAIFLYGKGII